MDTPLTATLAAQISLQLANVSQFNRRPQERKPEDMFAEDAESALQVLLENTLPEACKSDLPELVECAEKRVYKRSPFGPGFGPDRDYIRVYFWPFQTEVNWMGRLSSEEMFEGVKPLWTYLANIRLPRGSFPDKLCLWLKFQPVVLPGLTPARVLDDAVFKAAMKSAGFEVASDWNNAMDASTEVRFKLTRALENSARGLLAGATSDWAVKTRTSKDGEVAEMVLNAPGLDDALAEARRGAPPALAVVPEPEGSPDDGGNVVRPVFGRPRKK